MLCTFTRGIVLLPNDDVLPTADASTECFEENLLPDGALLPNSAHMSVSSLYQFLVLTTVFIGCFSLSLLDLFFQKKTVSAHAPQFRSKQSFCSKISLNRLSPLIRSRLLGAINTTTLILLFPRISLPQKLKLPGNEP
jgi:hypothetical protein